MRAYVLIETAVGTAGFVAAEVKRLDYNEVRLISSDAVTGPFDVIALLESPNLDTLARFVSERLQSINGVTRTTTCIA
jgi:DNA-binding Lrp family transcriptional regulator